MFHGLELFLYIYLNLWQQIYDEEEKNQHEVFVIIDIW